MRSTQPKRSLLLIRVPCFCRVMTHASDGASVIPHEIPTSQASAGRLKTTPSFIHICVLDRASHSRLTPVAVQQHLPLSDGRPGQHVRHPLRARLAARYRLQASPYIAFPLNRPASTSIVDQLDAVTCLSSRDLLSDRQPHCTCTSGNARAPSIAHETLELQDNSRTAGTGQPCAVQTECNRSHLTRRMFEQNGDASGNCTLDRPSSGVLLLAKEAKQLSLKRAFMLNGLASDRCARSVPRSCRLPACLAGRLVDSHC